MDNVSELTLIVSREINGIDVWNVKMALDWIVMEYAQLRNGDVTMLMEDVPLVDLLLFI